MKVIHLGEVEAIKLAELAARQDISTVSTFELKVYKKYIADVCKIFGLVCREDVGVVHFELAPDEIRN